MLAWLLAAGQASAQQQLDIDSILLGQAPCKISSGIGDPEGTVVGNVCDAYIRTELGKLYTKQSGNATNTGWIVTGTLDGNVPAPIVYAEAAVVRQAAAGADRYVSDWFVDGTTGVTHVDSYDTDSETYRPLRFRASMVGSHPYAQGFTGWGVTRDGVGDFRTLYADEMHVKAFIADLEQALAGGQIITKSVAVMAENFSIPAPGDADTMRVRDLPSAANMAVFEAGDIVRLRVFNRADGSLMVADAWGAVSDYADDTDGTQTWTFTRLTGASAGTLAATAVITADSLVLDYGVSGNGYYEVQAADGPYGAYSPYAQVVTWSGDSPIAANQTVRARLGKLSALTGSPDEFGLLVGPQVYDFPLRYIRASNQTFEMHGIDLTLWHGTTGTIRLSHAVPSLAIGLPLPSSYTSGTGFWVGNDAGTYKLRIGNPAGNRLTWDGTTLEVVGNGSGITSIEGGNITTGSITASQLAVGAVTADRINVNELSAITASLGNVVIGSTGSLSSGAASYSGGVGYWMDFNGGSPRFRIGDPNGSRMDWNGANLSVFTSGIEISDQWGIGLRGTSSDNDYARTVWWENGSKIQGRTDVQSLHLKCCDGGTWSQINLYGDAIGFWGGTSAPTTAMWLDQAALYPDGDESLDLGLSSGGRWANVYVGQTIYLSSSAPIQFQDGGFQGGSFDRYVCVDRTNGNLYASVAACN